MGMTRDEFIAMKRREADGSLHETLQAEHAAAVSTAPCASCSATLQENGWQCWDCSDHVFPHVLPPGADPFHETFPALLSSYAPRASIVVCASCAAPGGPHGKHLVSLEPLHRPTPPQRAPHSSVGSAFLEAAALHPCRPCLGSLDRVGVECLRALLPRSLFPLRLSTAPDAAHSAPAATASAGAVATDMSSRAGQEERRHPWAPAPPAAVAHVLRLSLAPPMSPSTLPPPPPPLPHSASAQSSADPCAAVDAVMGPPRWLPMAAEALYDLPSMDSSSSGSVPSGPGSGRQAAPTEPGPACLGRSGSNDSSCISSETDGWGGSRAAAWLSYAETAAAATALADTLTDALATATAAPAAAAVASTDGCSESTNTTNDSSNSSSISRRCAPGPSRLAVWAPQSLWAALTTLAAAVAPPAAAPHWVHWSAADAAAAAAAAAAAPTVCLPAGFRDSAADGSAGESSTEGEKGDAATACVPAETAAYFSALGATAVAAPAAGALLLLHHWARARVRAVTQSEETEAEAGGCEAGLGPLGAPPRALVLVDVVDPLPTILPTGSQQGEEHNWTVLQRVRALAACLGITIHTLASALTSRRPSSSTLPAADPSPDLSQDPLAQQSPSPEPLHAVLPTSGTTSGSPQQQPPRLEQALGQGRQRLWRWCTTPSRTTMPKQRW